MLIHRFAPGARAVFTRRSGGFSSGPYSGPEGGGLNLGNHVGDDPAAVARNRDVLAAELGAVPAWMSQVHGSDVCVMPSPGDVPEADALVIAGADRRAPAVLVADCVPVLLASESGDVRAAVHVGRRGLVLKVLLRALDSMRELTSEPIYAAIGPHICAACYEVSEELATEAERYGAAGTTRWNTPSIDLAQGVRRQLAGITLWEAGRCTLEDHDLYSYRRDGLTGRFAGIVLADTPHAIPEPVTTLR